MENSENSVKTEDLGPVLPVSIQYLAAFFGVTERSINKWVSEETAPRLERGNYDFIQFAAWYIQRQRRQIERLKTGDKSLNELEKRRVRINNRIKSIELKERLGEVVEFAAVRHAWLNECKIINRQLNALVYQIGAALNLTPAETETVKNEINRMREIISSTKIRLEDTEDTEDNQDPA